MSFASLYLVCRCGTASEDDIIHKTRASVKYTVKVRCAKGSLSLSISSHILDCSAVNVNEQALHTREGHLAIAAELLHQHHTHTPDTGLHARQSCREGSLEVSKQAKRRYLVSAAVPVVCGEE